MIIIYILFIFAFFVLILGVLEKTFHNRKLNKILIRVNVNGTRGKSTVTRLITGIFKEQGYKVIGKTTGTSARIIYWNSDIEQPIKRNMLGPNIIEQKKVVKIAAKIGANAFVTECMAVNPDYQIVFQEKLVKANIGVIVNVREDHLDLCGPTLDNVAEAFTSTIPYNGFLIASNSRYNKFFSKIAKERNTKMIIADETKVPKDYLNKFSYVLFPENVAIALAVADALKINREIALSGMLNANPDPGALQILTLGKDNPAYFVNAFAANDPSSTLMIYNHFALIGNPNDKLVVIVNCRYDRVDRTIQYAEKVLPNIKMGVLIVIGENTFPITIAYNKGLIKSKEYYNFEDIDIKEAFNHIRKYLAGKVIFGMGNIHGRGEEFVKLLEKYVIELEENEVA